MRLCKRCNKEAHKYLSKAEMESLRLEREALIKEKVQASADKAKEEEEKAAAKKEEAAEEESKDSEEAPSEA
jgi:hypothetical protein